LELNLLEKTELWITGIALHRVNLNELAGAVARVLELPEDAVLVVDVRDRVVVLDVLRRKIRAEQIVGKEKELLAELDGLNGVRVEPETSVHAQGVLGLIGTAPEKRDELLKRTARLTGEVKERVSRRGMVFASGREVQEGVIEDTNSPYLVKYFEGNGYKMNFGGVLPDDPDLITGSLRSVPDRGYGLVITTGGVGAEDKDFTVESICRLDPLAETPWILHFHAGEGRHVKSGVRIAVGKVDLTTFVALPGPHDEVRLAAPVLLEGLQAGLDKKDLAGYLGAVLREKWHRAMRG